MAKTNVLAQAGKDFLVFIATDQTIEGETYKWKLIGGQRSGGFSIKADDIDASYKGSGGWKTSLQGMKEWTVDLDGVYGASDEGTKELEKIATSGEGREFALVYPDKSYRVGLGILTEFGVDAPHDDVITYKGSIKGQGELSDVKTSFSAEA